MLLCPQDAAQFFKLHRSLMFFVNQRLKVIPDNLATPNEFAALPPDVAVKIRDYFVANVDLIESFLAENPAHLSDEELDIVRSWRHLVAGKFYVFRKLKKYTVFLSPGEQPIAYGVLALSKPFEYLVGPHLPASTETVLLPFKGKIVYDGLLDSLPISFGPGIRRILNETFKEAKMRHGIVTSLVIVFNPAAAADLPKIMAPRKTRPKTAAQNPFAGRWRITWMETWDQGFVDAEVEGFVEFGERRRGSLQFGYVSGKLHYQPTIRDGLPYVEWTWKGFDEMDKVTGRGWATLTGGEINGRIFMDDRDQSAFTAKR